MINLFIQTMEKINKWLCGKIKWLFILMLFIGLTEVVSRLLNRPVEWAYETLIMLGAGLYILPWGEMHRRDAHVKVDVFYNSYPYAMKKWIDILLGIVLHLPLLVMFTIASFRKMVHAWAIGEVSILTTWYPLTGPIKTIYFLAAVLFLLSVIARVLQDFKDLREYSGRRKGAAEE